MKIRFVLHAAAMVALTALSGSASSITTNFSGINGFSGNMFNATIGSKGIDVTGLDVNVSAGSETVDVYIKSGSYVGFDTTPAAWTLVSTTAVTGLGEGNATPVAVSTFLLSAGTTYGIYVTLTSTVPTMYYSNGSNTYSNSDLSLSLGDGLGGLFGSSGVFPSRTWNGTIDYTLVSTATPEPTSLAMFALGAPGLLLLRLCFRKY